MAKKKLEEPEKWITVNGQHLPVYPGGRIGQPGQKEEKKSKQATSKKETESKSQPKKISGYSHVLQNVTKSDAKKKLLANLKAEAKKFNGENHRHSSGGFKFMEVTGFVKPQNQPDKSLDFDVMYLAYRFNAPYTGYMPSQYKVYYYHKPTKTVYERKPRKYL